MSYRDLFQKLNAKRIKYVILRKYDRLPESTIEGGRDVDILIDPDQFQDAVDLSRTLDFEPEDNSGPSRLRVYRMAAAKPKKAILKLVQSPKESIRKVLMGSTAKTGNPRHEEIQLYRGSQMIDLNNNLAYKSPMHGEKIPVDPSITEGMLDRREEKDCFYIPTSPDELAHLIPHCVFDRDGEFSPYYVDRCEELFTEIRSNTDQLELFESLLGQIFFKAGQLVLDLVAQGRYAEIRDELKKFSDY